MASTTTQQLADYATRAILRKLDASPHAADTAEGIHCFWIDWSEPFPPAGITQLALERLALTGAVEKVLVDTRELWRKGRTGQPSS